MCRAQIFNFGFFSIMGKIHQKPLFWSFNFKTWEEVPNGANNNIDKKGS